MSNQRRVQQQPAYILHHRPFRDTSRILDILSRDHGKLAVVARGSRSAKSRLRGILRPFVPLALSWTIRSDMGTLTGAELNGVSPSLSGDTLLSGYYLNELLMHFLHRHDPQPEIFESYMHTLGQIGAAAPLAACLRRFEIELLRQLGYALELDREADSQALLQSDGWYEYRMEQGPVAVRRKSGPLVFSGSTLVAIGRRDFEDAETVRAAGRLLRAVIDFHLDGKVLRTRKVLADMHRR